MDTTKLCDDIVSWLKEQVFSSGGRGAVFGLSGGIDSAVVGVLCKKAFGEYCTGLIMPCYSPAVDIEHGELLAGSFGIPYKVVYLDEVFDHMLMALEPGSSLKGSEESLAVVNIKPRLRMTVLYYHAAFLHYRVIGTGNKSEIAIGYFTKYGDNAVDLEPLGDLLKEEVRELAVYLEVPPEIIEKKPSAGLWEGQTDEDEMGFTYEELDMFLRGGTVSPEVQEKIEMMQLKSEHKRTMPPVFRPAFGNK